jgi:hypothetical protein
MGIASSNEQYRFATKRPTAIQLLCPSSFSRSGDLWKLSSRPLKWILRTRPRDGVPEKGVSSPMKSSSSVLSRSHLAVGCRSCNSPVIFSDDIRTVQILLYFPHNYLGRKHPCNIVIIPHSLLCYYDIDAESFLPLFTKSSCP